MNSCYRRIWRAVPPSLGLVVPPYKINIFSYYYYFFCLVIIYTLITEVLLLLSHAAAELDKLIKYLACKYVINGTVQTITV